MKINIRNSDALIVGMQVASEGTLRLVQTRGSLRVTIKGVKYELRMAVYRTKGRPKHPVFKTRMSRIQTTYIILNIFEKKPTTGGIVIS